MEEEESTSTFVIIQVTEEDIEKGIPKNPEFSPIAFAIKRHLISGVRVGVIPTFIAFGVYVPFITFRFDTESKSKPLIFQMVLPQEFDAFDVKRFIKQFGEFSPFIVKQPIYIFDENSGFLAGKLINQFNESKISKAVTNFIYRFNHGLQVQPFSFPLDLPKWILEKETK